IGEGRRGALALVALQDDRVALDGAAAAEGVLEVLEPDLEVRRLEIELLDDGDFLAAAALALHAHDGAGRSFCRCGWRGLRRRFGAFGQICELAAQRLEGIVEGLLVAGTHAFRSQIAAKKPSVSSVWGRVR